LPVYCEGLFTSETQRGKATTKKETEEKSKLTTKVTKVTKGIFSPVE
jgi:hypothetical protein